MPVSKERSRSSTLVLETRSVSRFLVKLFDPFSSASFASHRLIRESIRFDASARVEQEVSQAGDRLHC